MSFEQRADFQNELSGAFRNRSATAEKRGQETWTGKNPFLS